MGRVAAVAGHDQGQHGPRDRGQGLEGRRVDEPVRQADERLTLALRSAVGSHASTTWGALRHRATGGMPRVIRAPVRLIKTKRWPSVRTHQPCRVA